MARAIEVFLLLVEHNVPNADLIIAIASTRYTFADICVGS
jgi:hypothetical protein